MQVPKLCGYLVLFDLFVIACYEVALTSTERVEYARLQDQELNEDDVKVCRVKHCLCSIRSRHEPEGLSRNFIVRRCNDVA